MKKRCRCAGCGEFFKPETDGKRLCGECRELIAVGGTKDLFEFERLRAAYNKRHRTLIHYGQFVEYISEIRERSKNRG